MGETKNADADAGRSNMKEALGCLPVWAVTSLSAGKSFPLEAGLFDLVVIDEASQSDVASALPLLYRAKRALIIGDPNQLAPIVTISEQRDQRLADSALLTKYQHDSFNYRQTSLFDRAVAVSAADPIFLAQHFRSHPAIIGFANEYIYDGRLKVRDPVRQGLELPPITWTDCRGQWRRGNRSRSACNDIEAARVIRGLKAVWPQASGLGLDIGIVSPFRAQVDLILEHLLKHLPAAQDSVAVDTVYGFQGDERDVIIFSPVISPDTPKALVDFAGNRHLLTVASTRARRHLIIVGDQSAAAESKTLLADLATYIRA